MGNLKVIINKAGNGVSAHLPELDGFLITANTYSALKEDLREGIRFHLEGLHPEEQKPWMEGEFDFEFV
jgi:predicted RNase H-like HicB family nuclease